MATEEEETVVEGQEGDVAGDDEFTLLLEQTEDAVVEEEVAEEEVLVAADEEAGGEGEAPAAEDEDDEAEPEPFDAEAAESAVDDGLLDEDDDDVQEHLKDAVDGSMRLKRILTQDMEDQESTEPGAKRRRTSIVPVDPAIEKKTAELLTKWGAPNDIIMRYVLEQLPMDELEAIAKGTWRPDAYNQKKTMSDQLGRYTAEMRERRMVNGMTNDSIATFSHRHKLNLVQQKEIRGLCHKDLRWVLDNYHGKDGQTLSDVIEEAAAELPDESLLPQPNAPGVTAAGRFARLELIDPLADCAVFGDANLTFSLRLAKHRKALGHVGRVIATTFEELDTLRERYKEIDQSIKTLEEHFAEVYHGVDCTRVAVDPRFRGMEDSLGAVYYNFPHSGAVQGFFDGHPIVNWRHENLMRLFFRSLRSFVKPGGFVKVSSNGNAVGVRYSYIVGGAQENEFEHIETMPFLEWHLHRYGRSYGDRRDITKRPDAQNNQSYNQQAANKDMVYCFRYKPSGENLAAQGVRYPPSLTVLNDCTEGAFKGISAPARKKVARDLHKRFTTEIGGTHVG